jgi:hypothetical protein
MAIGIVIGVAVSCLLFSLGVFTGHFLLGVMSTESAPKGAFQTPFRRKPERRKPRVADDKKAAENESKELV